MVPSKRSRHGYWPFQSSRILLPKETWGGGGGELPKYIGHHRQGLEEVQQLYIGIQDLTRNMVTDSEKHIDT